MGNYWHQSEVEVETAMGSVLLIGWRRRNWGVVELPLPGNGIAAYLVDVPRRRAVSPFESLPLAFFGADVAEQAIAGLSEDEHRGPAVHAAWMASGFRPGDRATGAGDPVLGWSAEDTTHEQLAGEEHDCDLTF